MRKLRFGFSPCPNDTFIFEALVNGKVPSRLLEFDFHIADVEELNRMALEGNLDVTKLSFHAFGHLTTTYQMLNAGAALGRNCGPLLIGKKQFDAELINNLSVAIPGKYTTANLLLGLAFPNLDNKQEMLFSDIESAILHEEVDAGLIIHENRFTYQAKGLKKIIDLGEFWEQNFQQPIPLGGIVVKREYSQQIKQEVDRLIYESLKMAFADPEATIPYVSQFAQEMDPHIMKQHIALYVNDFSLNLGVPGKQAVDCLLKHAVAKSLIPKVQHPVFVTI